MPFLDLVNTKGDDLLVDPASHTRNSSTTSQVSKGSGYESSGLPGPPVPGLNQGGGGVHHSLEKDKGPGGGGGAKGHSRQSSSGSQASNHGR